MRQVSLIIILSRLICHRGLREIRCELLLDWQSWLPSVPCSPMLTSALYLSCPAGTAIPSTTPLLLPYTRTHACSCTHPHRCVHVQGWYDSPLPPLCPCTVVGPTDQHAPLVRISIPGARFPRHVFPSARIASCHISGPFNATLDICGPRALAADACPS